ncbi:Mut7-C RNAse domain-containing protein [Natronorubrum halophilum]|uniref:Mut7-C RNAse domain-containing protein n=1 Tax=Natronorubrum halophilum TaxID=1702106 RepID=UPI000EF677D1|nr:Mut7-C RNAse domain-containing protein [Natronorubrum halophilum]
MCGGIRSYLRMCGSDTAYAGDRGVESDDNLLALASRGEHAILLESRDVEAQLAELAAAGLDLTLADEPAFCGRCNGSLERVDRSASTPGYAPDPAGTDVWRCRSCDQHFWRGSHWERVETTLSKIDEVAEEPIEDR